MYKDSPHEGFTWRKYLRSTLLSALIAVGWQLSAGFDLGSAGSRVVLFGLVYVTERGLIELYKGYFREEDQSKYFIPMQLHIMGRVVQSRLIRWSVAASWAATVALVGWGLVVLQGSGMAPLAAVLLIGSVGGWLSAFGGAFKDAPVEGFETLKFFRSPMIALLWSLLASCLTTEYPFIAMCGLGYTVATIETWKTFFFPNRPRGKFAGKPILFPRLLTWRHRFVPIFVAIWITVVANVALAVREPGKGVLRFPGVTSGPAHPAVDRPVGPAIVAR